MSKIFASLGKHIVDWVLGKLAQAFLIFKRQKEIDAEGKELDAKFEQAETEVEREDAFTDYINRRNRNK